MLKILYMLPALAILGMLPAADAATDEKLQERIDRLQAKIDRLQERIDAADPDRDAKRIDKWEKKIAKHEGRIAELQARMERQPENTARLTGTPEEPEPRALKSTSGDTTPPTVVSATLDGSTLTVVFDEAIDFDNISLTRIFLNHGNSVTGLQDATVANPSTDSDTLSLTLSEALSDAVREASDPSMDFARESVADVSRNAIVAVSVPVDVAGSTPPDTAPPAVLSATQTGNTLTIEFDEEVTVVHDYGLSIGGVYVTGGSVSAESRTVTATLSGAALDRINNGCVDQFQILPGTIKDGSGNFVSGTFDFDREATCAPANPPKTPAETAGNTFTMIAAETPDSELPPIATVTITADGRFEEDSGTVELAKSDLMAFSINFVNDHDRTHTVLADLISYNFQHASADIEIHPGATLNVRPWLIYPHMQPGDTAYFVYGVENDPGTPEHEPDTVKGDHVVEIRIAEPAS